MSNKEWLPSFPYYMDDSLTLICKVAYKDGCLDTARKMVGHIEKQFSQCAVILKDKPFRRVGR